MGRTKQTRPQRRSEDAVGDAPPLGWMTQHCTSSQLLAAELYLEEQQQQQQRQRQRQSRGVAAAGHDPSSTGLLDSDSDDDHMDKKPRAQPEQRGKSRLASVVAEIEEREEQAKRQQDNKKRQKQQQQPKKKKKAVSFATTPEAVPIPLPEIEIVRVEGNEDPSYYFNDEHQQDNDDNDGNNLDDASGGAAAKKTNNNNDDDDDDEKKTTILIRHRPRPRPAAAKQPPSDDGGDDDDDDSGSLVVLGTVPFPKLVQILLRTAVEDNNKNAETQAAVTNNNGNENNNISTTTTTTLRITTRRGAIDVWNLLVLRNSNINNDHHVVNGNSTSGGDDAMTLLQQQKQQQQQQQQKQQQQQQAVGRAVEAGTVRLEIVAAVAPTALPQQQQSSSSSSSSSTSSFSTSTKAPLLLKVSLTEKALAVCRPDELPLQSSRSRFRRARTAAPRHQAHRDVWTVLEAVVQVPQPPFSGSVHSNQAAAPVTAKQVYSLVDNAQLKMAMRKQQPQQLSESSSDDDERDERNDPLDVVTSDSIPGLVPTLRPYQQAAVRWMLQREQQQQQHETTAANNGANAKNNKSSDNNNNEWMLAWWVVVADDAVADQPETNGSGGSSSSSCGAATGTHCLSLPEWWQQQQQQQSYNKKDTVFFCPFTGWLVRTLDEARWSTMGNNNNTTAVAAAPGGILAESMGLGKTVEVLACILANPWNKKRDSDEEEKFKARRQLDFDQDSGDFTTAATVSDTPDAESSEEAPTSCENREVGYVEDDIREFGDAESDSNDSDSDEAPTPVAPEPCATSARAVPVTPEKEDSEAVTEPVGERWIDDDILGACICGRLIGFDTKSGPIVVCQNCEEPMHLRCTNFDSDEEMKRETEPLRYMQQFSNRALDCRVCVRNRCPCCVSPRESGSTLIVTPAAILNQWEREIRRHTRRDDGTPLRVVVYDGIKRLAHTNVSQRGNPAMRAMHPDYLAESDVVLMTFDSLMTDLTHTDDNRYLQRDWGMMGKASAGNLRKRKRYRVVPSPLLSIKWWRVCLDEAQRVETPTAGSAQMALKLEASHRWCVSGTPIGRGKLEDLYGLLLFLRVEPFCDKLWFRKCFSGAILPDQIDERIRWLLSDVFWRSTKSLDVVREQMGVPEQIEKTITLQFSSVEKHFYDRQLEKTLSAAGDLTDRQRSQKKRKASSTNLLSENLHKLRAACCHPQVGSSGINSVKRSRTNTSKKSGVTDNSVSSRVMSMTQILQTLIDDAKTKSEEAQRLAFFHNNAMAAICKLKVEAKSRCVKINDSDQKLLEASCKLYEQSLRMADENAEPTLVSAEAALVGSVGFRSQQKVIQECGCFVDWQWNGIPAFDAPAWSKFDFGGSGRRISQIRVRVITEIPDDLKRETSADFKWHLLFPKDCVFQCQSHGGEYVSVHSFSLPHPGRDEAEWLVENDFRTNKSKSWRVVVENFHPTKISRSSVLEAHSCGAYAGLDVEMFEAAIASDPLQRLHCLHNGSLSFSSLLQLRESDSNCDDEMELAFSPDEIRRKADSMFDEATKIESLYLGAARAQHTECKRRLNEASNVRRNLERSLLELTRTTKPNDSFIDCWDDKWWDDFLVLCRLHGSESQQQTVCERLLADLDGNLQEGFGNSSSNREGAIAFPAFGNIDGLRTALNMRIRAIRTGLGTKQSQKGGALGDLVTDFKVERFKCESGAHGKCMKTIVALSPLPGEGEIVENSRCHVCKADWNRKGPMCRHCKINEILEDLNLDKITRRVLQSLQAVLKGNVGASIIKLSPEAKLAERANIFFDLLDAQFKELRAAWRMWRTHLDLLNDLDELNSCKTTMRLTFEDEDVTQLPEEERNAVVVPVDVFGRYHDHDAKQATAIRTLSLEKGTLQYLKNQSTAEHRSEEANADGNGKETCSLCLDAFDSTRAVLRCGHSFHLTPCMEHLQARSGGAHSSISCPLRCRMRTSPDGILIASDKRNDDGSRNKRRIQGSYGTKVTRLVCDILDVCEMGAKSLVFSQWDDMLDICETALRENGVQLTRVKSLRGIADCTKRFRAPDCSVMLLNVKNGAEGLTLLEATNVFMIEPLLNSGLDSQAISRVHRIGQNRKTFVWRYLVADTVEMKIDQLRREHQEDDALEDAISEGKKSIFKAGGIDGGFQSPEEVLSILQ